MSLGIRGRLFVLAVVVTAVVDLLVGVYLERQLRGTFEDDLVVELTRHARSARALVGAVGPELTVEAVDPIADEAGAASGARITFLLDDGTLLGDSELTASVIAEIGSSPVEERPEVSSALAEGLGTSTRHSATADADLVFAAVPLDLPTERRLVARASRPVQRLEASVARLRTGVAIAGLLAVGVASLVLALVGGRIARVLRPVPDDPASAPPVERAEDPSLLALRELDATLEKTTAMLAAERKRFDAVLQTMDQAVIALDKHQRVVTVNRAARTLLSLPADVERKKLLEAVRVPALKQLVEDATEQQAKWAEFAIPGGKRVEARATRQSDGAVVLVVVDVSEIRRLERVRRDFVANVSHELRTPISVIKANAETLLDGGLDDPEAGRMFVDAVLRHADRLGRLVADLLDISRIEAGRYPLTLTTPLLFEVVEHVFESVEVDANKKNIALGVDMADELRLVADRKALEQVLINLVSNAVKYTPGGGHVEVRATPVGGKVRVEVRDDGPGIDPAHRGRIFERFYRADPGRSREMGGTGLGLSIVKNLVEAMHGEVGVDPRSPRGSVFWFTLTAPTPAQSEGSAANASQSRVS
jgi:two-component system phosphate regulon sensor histidine kinase PhoR